VKIGNTYRFNVSQVVAALSSTPKDDVKMIEPDAGLPVQLELDFETTDKDI
jgi:hypothetical protein